VDASNAGINITRMMRGAMTKTKFEPRMNDSETIICESCKRRAVDGNLVKCF